MPKKYTGLTLTQHQQVADVIAQAENDTWSAMQPVIESYGWTSPIGKRLERRMLTVGMFRKLSFACENAFFDVDGFGHPCPHFAPPSPDININSQKRRSYRMSVADHVTVGHKLHSVRNGMQRLAIDVLQYGWGKNSKPLKVAFKIVDGLDSTRSKFDDLFCKEYPRKQGPYSPYYHVDAFDWLAWQATGQPQNATQETRIV